MTNVELDERVTALEENSGGNNPNGNVHKVTQIGPRYNHPLTESVCFVTKLCL